eukprot:TRINITY_DN11584_c0_g3_i5.p1 TRINITY_DN11584_c0_g3~~TRINITY_DN11584_c0_g3_i5.p1  ORF type:complete len:109 (+),score=13.66 TRINITY_DN11584_c0_g3_i5:201-527(+)
MHQRTSEDVVVMLLEMGATLNAANQYGMTPLHTSCRYGNTTIAAMLLDRGADIAARDKGGHTPLHVACLHAVSFETAAMLLARGADVLEQLLCTWLVSMAAKLLSTGL